MLTRICIICDRIIDHLEPAPYCDRCIMDPLYRSYAKRMLGVDELPESLEEKLATTEEMVRKCKPCGCLSSTQTIASIIMLWELEELIKHLDVGFRPTGPDPGGYIDINDLDL